MTHRIVAALAAALSFLSAAQAEPVRSPADAALMAGWAENGVSIAALEVRLAPGWKTYWRVPGEAGVAPRFDWSGSQNLERVAIVWPAPRPFDEFGMTSFGYAERMVLPLRVTPQDPAAPVALRLSFTYGVCEKICVPRAAELTLTLPPAAGSDAQAQNAIAISLAIAAAPPPARALGLTQARCRLEGAGDQRRLTAALRFNGPAPDALATVEGPAGVRFGAAAAQADGAALTVTAPAHMDAGAGWLARERLIITLFTAQGVYALEGC